MSVQRAREQVPKRIDRIQHSLQVIVDVQEVARVCLAERRRLPPHQDVENVTLRTEDMPDPEDIPLEPEDLLLRSQVEIPEDGVLELVDLVGEAVDHRQVAIHNRIQD